MELTTNVYVQLAAADEEYAILNTDTSKKSILLVVKSDTQPTFNNATNDNAFEIKHDQSLTSTNLPGPIWGAPLNKSVRFAIQKWS